ncbi:MAG: type IV pilus biogenesis/stability protein PilW [Wenzhouxiangella sp.]|nr:MAG: type IV pilus biogenesis/stability protein PilW [Wenzhouxiangella sp.]
MMLRACLVMLAVALMAGCATTQQGSPSGQRGMERVSPVRAAEINTRLGVGYLERGQVQLAMEKLETALRHDPDHVPAHLTLALIYEEIGDHNRAGRHFRQASRLAPNDGGTQNSYAVFLCRQGDFRAADRHFMLATEDPFYNTPEVAWTNAGACARRSGDIEKANGYFRVALEIDPNFPDALFHLAELYYQQGEAFRARAFLQRLESAAVPEAGALFLGYRIESSLGNRVEANQYVSRLERQFPDSSEARELRGLVMDQ